MAGAGAAAAMHTNSARFSTREADSATSPLFSFLPLTFPELFAFLCEDLPISDIEQLILFLGSCANRISSGNPSSDRTNPTNTYLIRAE